MADKHSTVGSYVGASISFLAGLTLNEIGILAGILTAILTFGINAVFQWRRDKRDAEAHARHLDRLAADRRQLDAQHVPERRKFHPDCPNDCPLER